MECIIIENLPTKQSRIPVCERALKIFIYKQAIFMKILKVYLILTLTRPGFFGCSVAVGGGGGGGGGNLARM